MCVLIIWLFSQLKSFYLHTVRPLHIAARNGLATVVEVLLTRGAAVLAVDEDGEFPHGHRIAKLEPTELTSPTVIRFD